MYYPYYKRLMGMVVISIMGVIVGMNKVAVAMNVTVSTFCSAHASEKLGQI